MVRMYELHEVHECKTCGLMYRVTFAAVPVMPITCCGVETELIGIHEDITGFDLSPRDAVDGSQEEVYKAGAKYSCEICGIELEIIRQAQPKERLDCCGEGMDLIS